MRLVLLTGIPGTGKTTVGNHLAAEHGFRHLDFEDMATLRRMLEFGERGLQMQIAAFKQQGQDIVVSWGFVPDVHLALVQAMRRRGFDWVWLDGDRDAARRVFLERGTVPEELLDVQMAKIDRFLDLAALRPRIVNPFDGNGHFRDLEQVAAEVAYL